MLARRHARHLTIETIETIRATAKIFNYRVNEWNASNILKDRYRSYETCIIKGMGYRNARQRRNERRGDKTGAYTPIPF